MRRLVWPGTRPGLQQHACILCNRPFSERTTDRRRDPASFAHGGPDLEYPACLVCTHRIGATNWLPSETNYACAGGEDGMRKHGQGFSTTVIADGCATRNRRSKRTRPDGSGPVRLHDGDRLAAPLRAHVPPWFGVRESSLAPSRSIGSGNGGLMHRKLGETGQGDIGFARGGSNGSEDNGTRRSALRVLHRRQTRLRWGFHRPPSRNNGRRDRGTSRGGGGDEEQDRPGGGKEGWKCRN